MKHLKRCFLYLFIQVFKSINLSQHIFTVFGVEIKLFELIETNFKKNSVSFLQHQAEEAKLTKLSGNLTQV